MFCDEPFTPGHQHKHRRSQIYVMEGDDVDLESNDSSSDGEDHNKALVAQETPTQQEETPVLSINAINGSTSYNCMRLVGYYGDHKLHILVDPGSTHNFLDLNLANQLGCILEHTQPMSVKAATGDTLLTNYKCSAFTWKVQGSSFTTEIRTVPLDCCDFVLGVNGYAHWAPFSGISLISEWSSLCLALNTYFVELSKQEAKLSKAPA